MGLIAKKDNDFSEKNDGKTVLFTDLFTAPPVNDSNDDDQLQVSSRMTRAADEKRRIDENNVNLGKAEQFPKDKDTDNGEK